MATGTAVWRGYHLAARNADYWHGAHDFASTTLCGMPLDGSGLSEGNVTSAMREHPACAQAAPAHTTHTADDCPLRTA